MKKLLFAVGSALLISGCATTKNENVAQVKSVQNQKRLPATHIYGGSNCSNAKFELNYDGPMSNYAFGGLSNLYIKNQKNADGEPVKFLAYEDNVDSPMKVGEGFGDSGSLHINFSEELSKRTSKIKVSPRVGDKCTPDELDYQHSEWKTDVVVRIDDISAEASQKTGLKAGSKISFRCDKSSDVPVTCPKSGRYGSDDLR